MLGDHFEVGRALAEPDYVKKKWALLEKNGLSCFAISNHLVGQAVCDLIDERHKAILSAEIWGDGKPEGVRQRAADDARYFQISVPVQPGNSGGALVDEHGNVVGVVAAKLNMLAALNTSGTLPENVNYAIKSSYLLSFLESVPDACARLKEPETKDRKSEDVVKDAEQAAVLVLLY